MEHPPADDPKQPRQQEDLGEDHRGDPPGYDLDEQQAIQELERERDRAEQDQ